MTDLIRRLTAWVSLFLAPSPVHAKTAPPTPPAPQLPTPRSLYGLEALLPLAGEATPVRPYLTAHEQRSRRRELVLATLGLDAPGPCWIHGVEVA